MFKKGKTFLNLKFFKNNSCIGTNTQNRTNVSIGPCCLCLKITKILQFENFFVSIKALYEHK